jgi:hypothetical protein
MKLCETFVPFKYRDPNMAYTLIEIYQTLYQKKIKKKNISNVCTKKKRNISNVSWFSGDWGWTW